MFLAGTVFRLVQKHTTRKTEIHFGGTTPIPIWENTKSRPQPRPAKRKFAASARFGGWDSNPGKPPHSTRIGRKMVATRGRPRGWLTPWTLYGADFYPRLPNQQNGCCGVWGPLQHLSLLPANPLSWLPTRGKMGDVPVPRV